MAAKKKRQAAAPRKPKKRAGRPVKKKKASTKPKVSTKPNKVRPAADSLDNAPVPVASAETQPPPFRAETLPPPHWSISSDPAPWMWQQTRNVALLSTVGAVEPALSNATLLSTVGTSDSNALHAKMIEQIEALERAMADLREQQQHGIGHNNPPEPIETAPPLSEKELGEIKKAMAVLKKQPPTPTALGTKAKAALALLVKFARAPGAYVVKQADNFVTEAVKESGKRIVQWALIYQLLQNLADTAHQWLQSLGLHL
jgi:hypothetical protein